MIVIDAGKFYSFRRNANEFSSIFRQSQFGWRTVAHPSGRRKWICPLDCISLGFVLLIIGVAYGAHMAHVPTHWIAVTIIALLGSDYDRQFREPACVTHNRSSG